MIDFLSYFFFFPFFSTNLTFNVLASLCVRLIPYNIIDQVFFFIILFADNQFESIYNEMTIKKKKRKENS